MELSDVMRQLPGCREYRPDDVPDEVLYRVLDDARFAPSGGNRQGWRVVVVRDADLRRRLGELYLPHWQAYVAAHYGPYDEMTPDRRKRVADADRMAETLHEVPVHLLVWVELSVLAVTDIGADRPSVVAGGSVFPFIQNVQLAARQAGLGTRITTLLSYEEDAVRALVGAPPEWALAALVLTGWPVKLPTRLARNPVESFAFVDRANGAPLRP